MGAFYGIMARVLGKIIKAIFKELDERERKKEGK